ncbi:unnamed protein product [Cylicocyclus nassatus]|uniref:C-type lectin domain-containing protein n=1 Tax=Cylicocyclus nassatus TaxID=53992 RepID=A0AA36H9D4_CYLNA|nr:unnamed protein product [Cylicocyclus nassatus]
MMLRSIFALCFLAMVMAMRRPYSYPPYSYSQNKPKQSAMMQQPAACPSGWKPFQDSCYYYETKMMNFDKAEVNCLEKDALLFVAETNEEYKEVMKNSPQNYYTWVGMRQYEGEYQGRWASGTGIPQTQLDWLTPTYNGFSDAARCVAHFHTEPVKYALYLYCGMDLYSICEKNATHLRNIWDMGARPFKML